MCKPTKRQRPYSCDANAAQMLVTPMVTKMVPPDLMSSLSSYAMTTDSSESCSLKPDGYHEICGFNDLVRNGELDCMSSPEESQIQVACAENPSSEQTAIEAKHKTFVYSCFEMVSDPKNAATIGFSADGAMIEIYDLEALSESLLPKYFRHRNVTSFYRQLNSYGFRTERWRSPQVMHAFSHKLFQRNRADLLVNIVRKSSKRSGKTDHDSESQGESDGTSDLPNTSSSDHTSGASTPNSTLATSPDQRLHNNFNDQVEVLQRAVLKQAERIRVLAHKNADIMAENCLLQSSRSGMDESIPNLLTAQTKVIEMLFGSYAAGIFQAQAKNIADIGDKKESSCCAAKPVSCCIPEVYPYDEIPLESTGDIQNDDLLLLFAEEF